MDNLKQIIKENIFLILLTIFVIIAAIALFVVNKNKSGDYHPEIVEEIEYVQKNFEVNEYSVVNITLLDLLNQYLKRYLVLETTNPEEAFEMLSDISKKSFNNNIEKYKEYVKQNTTINTQNNEIIRYKTEKRSNKYEIVDSENYKYIIHENAIWDIKITLNGRE